jgi:drug/metabolite transporter (DMT)-like permease
VVPVGAEPLAGALLAIASAFAWSGLDALRKRLARDLSAPAILLGFTLPQVPLHASIWVASGPTGADLPFVGLTLIAAALTLGANILFVRAVALSPLSLTVPYLSFTPVLTMVFGAALLGQRPGTAGLVGVLAITAGALLLNSTPREAIRDPLRGLRRDAGSRIMLGVAALFALSTAIDRLAIVRASEPAYAATLTGGMALALLLRPGTAAELVRSRRAHRWIAIGALFTAAALLTQFVAYRYMYVAYVDSVKRAGGNLLALLLGAVFFSEKTLPRRLAAATAMSLGVVLVLLDPGAVP